MKFNFLSSFRDQKIKDDIANVVRFENWDVRILMSVTDACSKIITDNIEQSSSIFRSLSTKSWNMVMMFGVASLGCLRYYPLNHPIIPVATSVLCACLYKIVSSYRASCNFRKYVSLQSDLQADGLENEKRRCDCMRQLFRDGLEFVTVKKSDGLYSVSRETKFQMLYTGKKGEVELNVPNWTLDETAAYGYENYNHGSTVFDTIMGKYNTGEWELRISM